VAKVYPCKIVVKDGSALVAIDIETKGEVKGFTHLLNIEKGRLEIFGQREEGYFHLFLEAFEGEIFLKLSRGKTLSLKMEGIDFLLEKGKSLSILKTLTIPMPKDVEKISFGSFKKPLLEKGGCIQTKLYYLAQLIPKAPLISIDAIEPFFLDLCSPQGEDLLYRGIKEIKNPFDPFSLFSTFFDRLRRQMIIENGEDLLFLKGKVPHAGKVTGLSCEGCTIDFLWRKGKVMKMVINPTKEVKRKLVFSQDITSYRIKHHPKEKGKIVLVNDYLMLEKGKSLFIDRIYR